MNRAKATRHRQGEAPRRRGGVLPEMAARVSFLAKALDPGAMKEPPKIVVPATAVTERAGAKMVFVVDGERVHAVPVVARRAVRGRVRVLKDGPPPGTRLVKNPPPAAERRTEHQGEERMTDEATSARRNRRKGRTARRRQATHPMPRRRRRPTTAAARSCASSTAWTSTCRRARSKRSWGRRLGQDDAPQPHRGPRPADAGTLEIAASASTR